jgi:hypothetical protein
MARSENTGRPLPSATGCTSRWYWSTSPWAMRLQAKLAPPCAMIGQVAGGKKGLSMAMVQRLREKGASRVPARTLLATRRLRLPSRYWLKRRVNSELAIDWNTVLRLLGVAAKKPPSGVAQF